MTNSIQNIFDTLMQKKDLDERQSDFLVKKIFNRETDPVQTAIILTLMHQKGESFEEIYSFIKYLKSKSLKLKNKVSEADQVSFSILIKLILLLFFRHEL